MGALAKGVGEPYRFLDSGVYLLKSFRTRPVPISFDPVNGDYHHGSDPHAPANLKSAALPRASTNPPFFQKTDWLAFGVTTTLTLLVYLVTLAPEVTLGFSGIFSTGAMYAGVPHPPGYPVWTVYAWLFTLLLPVSNIAWRVAVSSAVAGALACGLVALMVSRGGAMIVKGIAGLKRLFPKEERRLRVVAGVVAGAALGFDGAFWGRAVIADVWTLSTLLFTLVLCLLLRWVHSPDRKRCLYFASLVYGLTISNSQAMLASALGLQLLVMIANRKIGRDLFFADSVLFIGGWAANQMGYLIWPGGCQVTAGSLPDIRYLIAIASIALCVGLAIQTRRLLTEWKPALLVSVMFLLGASAYLYVPLASMTNPPINWGYARTVSGFVHVLTRGQYEQLQPTNRLSRFADQIRMYGKMTVEEFGLHYVLIALIPLCFLLRMPAGAKRWMLGLLAVYLCLALVMLAALNPASDRQSGDFSKALFSASHLVLAIWTGYGLVLAGIHFSSNSNSLSR